MKQPPLPIINGCKKNDRRAQHELFRLSYSFLMNVCTRYRKNEQEAKALLNEGFLKILLNLSKYDLKIPFAVWARKVVVNTIIDDFRKNKNWKRKVSLEDFSGNSTKEKEVALNTADLQFDADYLLSFVNALPTGANKVFNLFAIDGFSHKEIATMLQISEGTSKWHLNDARKRLKKMIENYHKTKIGKGPACESGPTRLRKKLTS